jgi:flagellar hook-length control protein FliK
MITSTVLDQAHLETQIVQAIRLQWRDGMGTARLTLDPEYLGAVTIALRVEHGQVTAAVHAENPDVRAWVQSNQSLLTHGLSQQGLSLDRLIISHESPLADSSADDRRRRRPLPPGRRAPRAASGTFEIVV